MKHIEEYPIKVKFTKSFTTTAIETTTQNGEKYLEVGDKIRFLEENDLDNGVTILCDRGDRYLSML